MADPILAYPAGDALKLHIQSTGLIKDPPSGAAALIDYDARMLEVVDEWESGTGYTPFLADSAVTVTPYDAGEIVNGRLSLRGGMVSVSGVSVGGVSYVPGVHYRLLPLDAPLRKKPYKEIEFCGALAWAGYGAEAQVLVTGVRGYWGELPAKVWGVMLDRGFSLVAPQLALKISGGRTDIRAGKVSLSFVRASGNRSSSGGPLSGRKLGLG